MSGVYNQISASECTQLYNSVVDCIRLYQVDVIAHVNRIRLYTIVISEIQWAQNQEFISIQFACNPIQLSLNENEYFLKYCTQLDTLNEIQFNPSAINGILTGIEGLSVSGKMIGDELAHQQST